MTHPIDSRQLRAFAALARTGSFTLAAKELFLSQSAVSHSMKALENDVGCRLFDRVGKKVLLTQAGEALLHHADKILQEMGAARAGLQQLGKWGVGRLRIGASPTACQYILPAVLREFKESFPKCMIAIDPGDFHDDAFRISTRRDNEVVFELRVVAVVNEVDAGIDALVAYTAESWDSGKPGVEVVAAKVIDGSVEPLFAIGNGWIAANQPRGQASASQIDLSVVVA